jgi:hypothetical protein
MLLIDVIIVDLTKLDLVVWATSCHEVIATMVA